MPLHLERLEDRLAPATVTINTANLTVNGSPNTIYGTPFTASVVNGVAEFKVLGNLNVPAGDTVVGSGPYAVELLVANNVTIGAGAMFQFSAAGQTAGPGGGVGGGGGSGGVSQTTVGSGGHGGQGGTGGSGGSGGIGTDTDPSDIGTAGSNGNVSVNASGNAGTNGQTGSTGGNSNAGGSGTNGFGGAAAVGGGREEVKVSEQQGEMEQPLEVLWEQPVVGAITAVEEQALEEQAKMECLALQ